MYSEFLFLTFSKILIVRADSARHGVVTMGPLGGWLFKLGGGKQDGHNWFSRYFVLRGDMLAYYSAQPTSVTEAASPSGVACVRECGVQVRPPSAATDGALRYPLALTSRLTNDVLVLAAATRSDAQAWHDAIVAASRQSDTMWKERSVLKASTVECNSLEAHGSFEVSPSGLDDSPAPATPGSDLEAQMLAASEALALALEEVIVAEEEQTLAERQREDAELWSDAAAARLIQARARLSLRKSLLHWRHRCMRSAFETIVTSALTAAAIVSPAKLS